MRSIIGARAKGTTFFDLSDPGDPVSIGFIDGPDSLWRDIKVYGTYARYRERRRQRHPGRQPGERGQRFGQLR
ncbi:MAG: hypothetical protein R3F17_14685 [Planctomycetota bacterium]